MLIRKLTIAPTLAPASAPFRRATRAIFATLAMQLLPFLPTDNELAGSLLRVPPHAVTAAHRNRLVLEQMLGTHGSSSSVENEQLLQRDDVADYLRTYLACRQRPYDMFVGPAGSASDDLLRVDELTFHLLSRVLPKAAAGSFVDVALLLDAAAVYSPSNADALASVLHRLTMNSPQHWTDAFIRSSRTLAVYLASDLPRLVVDVARKMDGAVGPSEPAKSCDSVASAATDALVGMSQLLALCPAAAFSIVSPDAVSVSAAVVTEGALLPVVIATYEITLPALKSLLRAANKVETREIGAHDDGMSVGAPMTHVNDDASDGLVMAQRRRILAAAHACLSIAHSLLHHSMLGPLGVEWPAETPSAAASRAALLPGARSPTFIAASALVDAATEIANVKPDQVLAVALSSLIAIGGGSRDMPTALKVSRVPCGTFFADMARVFDLYRRLARLRISRSAKVEAEAHARAAAGLSPAPKATSGRGRRARDALAAPDALDDETISTLLSLISRTPIETATTTDASQAAVSSLVVDDKAMKAVMEVLPDFGADAVRSALSSVKGDTGRAIELLLSGSVPEPPARPSGRSSAQLTPHTVDRELRMRTLQLAAMQEEREAAAADARAMAAMRYGLIGNGDMTSSSETAATASRALAETQFKRNVRRGRLAGGDVFVDGELGCVVVQRGAAPGGADDGGAAYNDERDDAYDEMEHLSLGDSGQLEDEGAIIDRPTLEASASDEGEQVSEAGSQAFALLHGGGRGGRGPMRGRGRGRGSRGGSEPTVPPTAGHGDRAAGGYNPAEAARKGENKAHVGNHNRKRGADKKASRGMY